MNTAADLLSARLQNHRAATEGFDTPHAVVKHMTAMQAQDYPMSKWAVGIRGRGITNRDVEAALDRGEILRTHILRPTWHLVCREDIHWMLDLSANRIKNTMATRLRELELDGPLLDKCNRIIERAFDSNPFLTRNELVAALNLAGISTSGNRTSHILANAELDGLICSGKNDGNQQTYAWLPSRVITRRPPLSRPEMIVLLAHRYFFSHGPATAEDFAWWSGLTLREARSGFESLDPQVFVPARIGAHTYRYAPAPRTKHTSQATLLPAFDEFIIAYTNRDLLMLPEPLKRAIAVNGMFRPVLVVGGAVTGVWTRMFKKDKVMVEIQPFRAHSSAEKQKVEEAASEYGRFLGAEAEVHFLPE